MDFQTDFNAFKIVTFAMLERLVEVAAQSGDVDRAQFIADFHARCAAEISAMQIEGVSDRDASAMKSVATSYLKGMTDMVSGRSSRKQ